MAEALEKYKPAMLLNAEVILELNSSDPITYGEYTAADVYNDTGGHVGSGRMVAGKNVVPPKGEGRWTIETAVGIIEVENVDVKAVIKIDTSEELDFDRWSGQAFKRDYYAE